jgi:magnesium transporter
MDIVETDREIAPGPVDVQVPSVSARLNGIMNVPTINATKFISLGFTVSPYGMNFARSAPWNTPEPG